MLLILKVILTVTLMICAMLIGFVGILKLDISPNLTSFLTLSWIGFILYLPRIIFKEGDK
jgi:uncharacterized protein YqgC (DUF456 family)